MVGKQSSSIPHPHVDGFSPELTDEMERKGNTPKYVIQRSGELIREWWTGNGWSEDLNEALVYSREPDVSTETLDESAIAVRVKDLD